MNLIQIRHYLHQHPEVSGKEEKTAAFIISQLKELSPDKLLSGLGGHGIVAIYDSKKAGPSILFRAELDALPIAEINTMPYRSVNEGVGHKCGHDGHAAVLLGLAKSFAERRPDKGRILLLFQPAEETGEGAASVFNDHQFEQILPIDYAFAFHNLPGFPLGKVILKEGSFSASVKSIIVRLTGKTSHAAEPENGINPALAIAEIIQAAEEAAQPELDNANFAILTPVHIKMGEIAYGVSAGEGEVHLTIRTWNEASMEKLSQRLLSYLDRIAGKYHLQVDTQWTNVFLTNRNSSAAVSIIEKATQHLQMEYEYRQYPFKWGEDFGVFTQQFSGAMFGLGAGQDSPALHNPDYDFPDELLEPGVRLFREVADLALGYI